MYRASRFIYTTATCSNSQKYWQFGFTLHQILPEMYCRFCLLQLRGKHSKTIRRFRPTKAIRICTRGGGRSGKNVRNKGSNSDGVPRHETASRGKYKYIDGARLQYDDSEEGLEEEDTSIKEIPDSQLIRGVYYPSTNMYEESSEFEERMKQRNAEDEDEDEDASHLEEDLSDEEYSRESSSRRKNKKYDKVNFEKAVLSSHNRHGEDYSMKDFVKRTFDKSHANYSEMESSSNKLIETSEHFYFPSEKNPFRITIVNNMTQTKHGNHDITPFAVNVINARESPEDAEDNAMDVTANTLLLDLNDSGLDIKLLLPSDDKHPEPVVNIINEDGVESYQPSRLALRQPKHNLEGNQEPIEASNKGIHFRTEDDDSSVWDIINKDEEFHTLELTKTEQNETDENHPLSLIYEQLTPSVPLNKELFSKELKERLSDKTRKGMVMVIKKEKDNALQSSPHKNKKLANHKKQQLEQKMSRFIRDVYDQSQTEHDVGEKEQPVIFYPIKNYSIKRDTPTPADSMKEEQFHIPMQEFYEQLQKEEAIQNFDGSEKIKEQQIQMSLTGSDEENYDSRNIKEDDDSDAIATSDDRINQLFDDVVDDPKNKPQVKKIDEKLHADEKKILCRFRQDVYEINHTEQDVEGKPKELSYFPIEDYYIPQHTVDCTAKTKGGKSSETTMYGFTSAKKNAAMKPILITEKKVTDTKTGKLSLSVQKTFEQQKQNAEGLKIFGGTKHKMEPRQRRFSSESEGDDGQKTKKFKGKITANPKGSEKKDVDLKKLDESLSQYKVKYSMDDDDEEREVKKADADDEDDFLVKRELIFIPEEQKKKGFFSGFRNIVTYMFTNDKPNKTHKRK